MSDEPIRVISLPCDDGACGWYRIRQPLALLKNHTPNDAHIIDPQHDNMVEVVRALSIADTIIYRQGAEVGISALKRAMNDYYQQVNQPPKKQKWVLDIDDNVELVSPYSAHYEEYGTEEIFDKNTGKWLWKDGQAGFDLARNRSRTESFLNGMRRADMVTVTTEKLAQYARKYNKNVAILPNCLNFKKWWQLNLKPNEQLRVGWTGGISHYEDWYSIREPLNKLMRKYQFKLVMSGADFTGVIDQDNRHLIELHDWVGFKAISYHTMSLALDFAIIPLANLPFNHYKSSLKFYEMGAAGIPSVVSNILPYSEDVIHDKTGLLYKTGKEFYESVTQMITRPHVRHTIGQAAKKWVEDNRDAVKNIHLWVEAYS